MTASPPPPPPPPPPSRVVVTPWYVLGRMALSVIIPTIPVLVWWKWAHDERQRKIHEVRTRVRVPSVQTVDDLLVEKCKPGDIVLFDRRCEACATGPHAALACLLGRSVLCDTEDPTRSVDTGRFDHCGTRITRLKQQEWKRFKNILRFCVC